MHLDALQQDTMHLNAREPSSRGTSSPKPAAEKQETIQHGDKPAKIGFRQRIKHFTWAWFLSTMSTGGLAIAIAETPHKFHGLHTIGLTIFLLNILLFAILCTCTICRATLHPAHVLASLTHASESFFFAALPLSISVLIACTQLYGIAHGPAWPWLLDALNALYWIYAGLSLLLSLGHMYILISHSAARPVATPPAVFLPCYTVMLTGTLAALIAPHQPPGRAAAIVLSGCAFQGCGWLLAMVCTVFVLRGLLDNGLPPARVRPALFIPVGAGAYTIVALLGQADAVPQYGYFAAHTGAKEILQIVALVSGVFLWLFSFWLCGFAVLANVSVIGRMPFSLAWWAFVFPNVGLTLATGMIGRALGSEGVLWVASGMTAVVAAVWGVVVVGCWRAVWKGGIVWPGRDEDRDR